MANLENAADYRCTVGADCHHPGLPHVDATPYITGPLCQSEGPGELSCSKKLNHYGDHWAISEEGWYVIGWWPNTGKRAVYVLVSDGGDVWDAGIGFDPLLSEARDGTTTDLESKTGWRIVKLLMDAAYDLSGDYVEYIRQWIDSHPEDLEEARVMAQLAIPAEES